MRGNMTKLPEKSVFDGSKQPRTTTGEMKEALGKLRNYLNELLGNDSMDKEAARLALGIDLEELNKTIKAKADLSEVESKTFLLEEAIAKKGNPVGSIEYFAMNEAPAGYLKADGIAVGRNTYPDLFAVIGTNFGEGDGEKTFNLPDLIGRFPEGDTISGIVKEAGLPNIVATFGMDGNTVNDYGVLWNFTGAMSESAPEGNVFGKYTIENVGSSRRVTFSAESSNAIYGNSETVQPSSLTLLPCIKAFDAMTNPGLIDISGLANDFSELSVNKLDKMVNGNPVKYVIDTFNNETNWYRKWSDGWIEQGGVINGVGSYGKVFINFQLPFSERIKMCFSQIDWGVEQNWFEGTFNADARAVTDISGVPTDVSLTGCAFQKFSKRNWYACGY